LRGREWERHPSGMSAKGKATEAKHMSAGPSLLPLPLLSPSLSRRGERVLAFVLFVSVLFSLFARACE